MRSLVRSVIAAAIGSVAALSLSAQTPAATAGRPAPELWRGLHWRNIGPEGNRFSAAVGIPGDPLTSM